MSSTALPARDWRVDYDIALEVAAHEAIVRQAYKDSVGKWTWSVGLTNATGHDVTRYIGKPSSLERALAVYVWALERYAAQVRSAFGNTRLTKAQFAAALSFHWNTGAISRAAWVRSFKAGDVAKARREIMTWNKPPEIVGRRGKERDLFFDGKWSNNGTMTEYTRVRANGTPDWGSAKRINVEKELRAAFAAGAPKADLASAEPLAKASKPEPAVAAPSAPLLTREVVRALQQRLRDLGYYEVGIVDGVYGPRTQAAATAFQVFEGLTVTGQLDEATITRLDTAKPRPVAADRAERTLDDLRAGGAQVVVQTDKVKSVTVWGGVAAAFATVADAVGQFFGDAWGATAPFRDAFASIPGWAWGIMAVVAAIYMWRRTNSAQLWRLDDERTGRHNGVPIPEAPRSPERAMT